MAYTTINDPTDYFNTVLYTGNGSTQSITGVGFQPDWVWQKTRNYDYSQTLADVVRGASLNMFTNNTLADQTVTNGLTSFDSDGFSVGADLGWNASASDRNSKVAWNFKAGGTASSNTDGSITSTVSANTTSGFSIVSYTGAGGSSNVGHGLGVAPNLIIAKNRQSSSLSWFVSCDAIGWTKRLKLDGTNSAALNVAFGDTNPDSTKFYLQDNNLNTSGETHIAYCFAEKAGYSKFGSYEGNNATDNAFIYTGFKPAWVMVKNIDANYGWQILDNKRNTYNPADDSLFANLDTAEDVTTGDDIDFLSNGFKVREGGNSVGDNYTYIYMAFAEHPFVSSTGTPTTAR